MKTVVDLTEHYTPIAILPKEIDRMGYISFEETLSLRPGINLQLLLVGELVSEVHVALRFMPVTFEGIFSYDEKLTNGNIKKLHDAEVKSRKIAENLFLPGQIHLDKASAGLYSWGFRYL